MMDDLRDKIAEALEAVTMAAAPTEPAAAQSRVAVVPSPAAFTAILDAVLTVVTPELERLRELTATCTCGDSYATYEGPQPGCPVHGAIRAFNVAQVDLSHAKQSYEELAKTVAGTVNARVQAEAELDALKASTAAFEADINRIIEAGGAEHEQALDELRRIYVERGALKDRVAKLEKGYGRLARHSARQTAAVERVRTWHRPMHIYDGDAGCLGDDGCVHGEDYPIGEEGPTGGFCPHTRLAAVICFACSYQDTEGEGGMWPRWGWVLHENCATIARLDPPIEETP
jgi:hypothetical protein